MAIIEQVYNLDLVPNGRPLVVNVSQYDQGSRALTFNFFKDNVAFTPPVGYAAYITGTKPDGTGFMHAMTVSGSAATVEVTQQMCAVAGECPCEIRLIDGNSNVLGTANFTLSVERAAMDDDTVISESDIPYFEELATQAAASAAAASASETNAASSASAAAASAASAEPTYCTVAVSATATADSTWYRNGYMMTITADGITSNSTGDVTFPNADYSGYALWFTADGSVSIYFSQDPNGLALRFEWKNPIYRTGTVS